MRVCGQTIGLMELEFTSIIVVHHMKVSGKMISSTDSVLKSGLIIQSIKDSMRKEVKMDLVLIIGQMEVTMKASGHIIKFVDLVLKCLVIKESTLGNGQKI